MSKIPLSIFKVHIHKWETLNTTKFENEQMRRLGIPSKKAHRRCTICGKEQDLDIHCLGLKPPKYVRNWVDVETYNNNNYNSIW